jgi:membrane-associated phospholipid phosphatase
MHAFRISARTIAFALALAGTTLLFTAAQADTVTEWNSIWLDCIRATGGPPCPIARAGAMVHAAVYDAVNSIHPQYGAYLATIPAAADASPDAAAAAAAHDVLVALYPGRQTILDAALAASLGRIPDGDSKTAGIQIGQQAALNVIQARQNDGSDDATPYTIGTAPGEWRPTYPDYTSPPFSPNWGIVTPWVIQSGQQFRPRGPLGFTDLQRILIDPKYTKMFRDGKELGARNSKKRSVYQTQTAFFWANDVDGTYKPPGHLNAVAQVLSAQRHLTLEENARFFAILNLALGDAGIVAWDCKYRTGVDFWRPITGIREADTDGNPLTIADPTWEPLNAFTPPFPAYISGHATFASTAAAIFRKYFGTDKMTFTVTTDEPLYTGGARTYRTFSEAAVENAQSRIFLGVHWQFDADDGLAAGRALGEYVFAHALLPLDAGAPLASATPAARLSLPVAAGAAPGTIKYTLTASGSVRVAIFDVRGRLVRTLIDGWQAAGPQVVRWDRRDAGGGPVAAGIYFARVEANRTAISAKIAVFK